MVVEAPGSPSNAQSIPDALPVLPLRGGMVVLPLAVMPLMVGQPRSVQLINDIMRQERLLVLVAQRTDHDQPGPDDLYKVGTAAIPSEAVQNLPLPLGVDKPRGTSG